jgi:DNA-binding transcriptional LysR family regulator
MPVLTSWHQTFSGYKLNLQLSDQRLDLMQHEFDIALRVGDSGDSSYRQIYLGQLENSLIVQSALYLSKPLNQIDSVVLPWQTGLKLEDWQGNPIPYAQNNVLAVNTVSSAISAVTHGMGMAVIPTLFVLDRLRKGELILVKEAQTLTSRPVYLLHAYDTQLPFPLRHLAEKLKAQFQEQPQL